MEELVPISPEKADLLERLLTAFELEATSVACEIVLGESKIPLIEDPRILAWIKKFREYGVLVQPNVTVNFDLLEVRKEPKLSLTKQDEKFLRALKVSAA